MLRGTCVIVWRALRQKHRIQFILWTRPEIAGDCQTPTPFCDQASALPIIVTWTYWAGLGTTHPAPTSKQWLAGPDQVEH